MSPDTDGEGGSQDLNRVLVAKQQIAGIIRMAEAEFEPLASDAADLDPEDKVRVLLVHGIGIGIGMACCTIKWFICQLTIPHTGGWIDSLWC